MDLARQADYSSINQFHRKIRKNIARIFFMAEVKQKDVLNFPSDVTEK